MRKGFIALGTLIAMALSMPFVSTAVLKISKAKKIYHTVEVAPQKDAALVLGAAAYGSKLSTVLRDRVEVGIELYKAGKVEKIIMSGASNESGAMKLYAIKQEVPVEDVIEDKGGVNTLASIKNVMNRKESYIIVSQEYHLPRALFMAHHFDVEAVGVTADRHKYNKMFDFKKRELIATSWAVWNLLVLGN